MKNSFLISLIIIVIGVSGCDEDIEANCLNGTVLSQITCNSENGLAYLIEVKSGDSKDTIATTTLPDKYKVEGTKIYFTVEEPSKELFCTTNIIPPRELDLINVSTKSCKDE